MMEKRWLIRLIGSCLAVCCLAGCSGSSTAPDSNSVPEPALSPPDLPGPPIGVPQVVNPLAPEGIPGEYTDEQLLAQCLPTERLDAGWVRLFDGYTLLGWFSVGQADWRAHLKQIDVSTGEHSHLCTNFQITNYELLVDFRCGNLTDSGICLRSIPDPQNPSTDCYEVNIASGKAPFPTGSLNQRQARQEASDEGAATIHSDGWNTCRIVVENQQIKVWLNDQLVNDYTIPDKPRRGHIALQYKAGPISFRNILMRPIGLTPMLSGDSWEDAWKKVTATDAQLDVTAYEGKVHLHGGPGQLQTKGEWKDFLMQATYKLAAPEVDSGILFRCSPTILDQGYECQLTHALSPTGKPLAGGAGAVAISNRPAENVARSLVGDGTEPTYVTLLAEDAQITTWINGLLIADHADTRDVNDNPRIGSKRAGGPIALQAKNPSTDVEFSRLLIVPIE